jgi:ParB family chromosome partitioning protein
MSTQSTTNPPEKKKTIEIEMPPEAQAAPGNGEKKAEAKDPKKDEKKPEVKSAAPPPPPKKEKEPDDLPKVGATFMLKVNEILVKPGENARQKFNAKTLNEMAETLKNLGQLQALSVYWEEGKWYLIAGERRLRAAKIAGLTKLECKRVKNDPGDIHVTRIVENEQRENLSYYEQALDYKRALGTKLANGIVITQKWLAERIGKTEGYVSQRLSCLEMAQEIQDKMRENKVPLSVARELWAVKNPEQQLEIFRKALSETGEIDKKSVKKASEKARSKAKGGKKLGRPPLTDDGELPDIAHQGLEEACERLRHTKVELRKKEEMREAIATVYERFMNSRSDEKKNYLKGYAAGLEYAASIRKDL